MGKDMDRDRDEAVTTGSTLASAKAKVHRLTSKLDEVRKRYKGSKTNHRDSADRANAAAGRERYEAERLHDILEEEEVQRDGIIGNIKELRGILEAIEGK